MHWNQLSVSSANHIWKYYFLLHIWISIDESWFPRRTGRLSTSSRNQSAVGFWSSGNYNWYVPSAYFPSPISSLSLLPVNASAHSSSDQGSIQGPSSDLFCSVPNAQTARATGTAMVPEGVWIELSWCSYSHPSWSFTWWRWSQGSNIRASVICQIHLSKVINYPISLWIWCTSIKHVWIY